MGVGVGRGVGAGVGWGVGVGAGADVGVIVHIPVPLQGMHRCVPSPAHPGQSVVRYRNTERPFSQTYSPTRRSPLPKHVPQEHVLLPVPLHRVHVITELALICAMTGLSVNNRIITSARDRIRFLI